MGTSSCGCFPFIYKHWISEIFIKTLIIIFLFNKIIDFMCMTLKVYKSLDNNSIVEDIFNKESQVCIQLSSSIHQESRDQIR